MEDLHDLLMEYSEWLDQQGVMKPDTVGLASFAVMEGQIMDERSHDELATDFLAQRGDRAVDAANAIDASEQLFGGHGEPVSGALTFSSKGN